jgi:hypothetical protein
LSDFSPKGIVYFVKFFLKNTEVAQIFVLLFSTARVEHSFRPKNGSGYILGDFFANPTCHPARRQRVVIFVERNRYFSSFIASGAVPRRLKLNKKGSNTVSPLCPEASWQFFVVVGDTTRPPRHAGFLKIFFS